MDMVSGTLENGLPDSAAMKLPARRGLRHWRQAEVTDATLDARDNIFFTAIEMTRMPIILADPRREDCPIAFANNAFLDLTGYEEREVVGRNCRFLQGPGTDPEHVRQLRDAIEQRRTVALEILNYRRDGTPFWNAVFMGPVFDRAGELVYFFASQLDVSQRRESEQQFRQSQKMEAIGQLTAGLAHDFNNLLQIIGGSLERLKSKRLDGLAFERHHDAALQAADRGAKITRQLLAFARKTRLEPKGTDLTALINAFSELLETSVGTKIDLHFNLQRRLPQIMVDQAHLETALLNIVVNARDASPEGGSVTITTRAVELNAGDHNLAPSCHVMLSISDKGSGMPPHVRARAMEPFFTTKGPTHGTGLGLAMVHGFVEKSGGCLQIESELGEGTTVTLLFPQHSPEPAAICQDRPSTGYAPHAVDQTGRVPIILVVDDGREIAEMAGDTLVETGYRVVVVHTAEAAIEAFDAAALSGEPFDLVFSDVLIPGGASGLVLAQHVRKRSPTTPMILTTGFHEEVLLDGLETGALEVLGKPYRGSELTERIQSALRRGARTGADRQTSDFGHVQA